MTEMNVETILTIDVLQRPPAAVTEKVCAGQAVAPFAALPIRLNRHQRNRTTLPDDRRYLCAAPFSDDGAPIQGSSSQSTPKRFP
jgi:hypothetical protein